VTAPDVEELEHGDAHEVALQNAQRKAAAVARDDVGACVLGADTVVTAEGKLHGEASDRSAAAATLRALSGREHLVVTGLCLIDGDSRRMATAATAVTFRAIDPRLLEWYLDSGEWRERAGAYAIQGRGAALVARVDGDYQNVVGLPLATLLELEPSLLLGG
jgi:septum formation protein